MSKKGHRDGGKFKGHTTVIEPAEEVVDALAELDYVTGISPAKIENTSGLAQHRVVTTKETRTAIEMEVRGNRCVQVFYIYTTDKNRVIQFLVEMFPPPTSIGKRKGKRGKNKTHASANTWDTPAWDDWRNR